MAKNFVVFGATGGQGGSVARQLLKAGGKYNVIAVTRNKESDKAKALEKAGATLVQADMDDPSGLKEAVKGAHFIYAVTDFPGAGGDDQKESKQGCNLVDAAGTALDTLEAFIWSSLPNPRDQPVPYQNVAHFNSKRNISDRLKKSACKDIFTEVWMGPYYENFVNSHGIFEPEKQADGTYILKFPMNNDSEMAFASVKDLGRLVEVVANDPVKYRNKVISVISQTVTPVEMVDTWAKSAGVKATYQSLSTEDYQHRLAHELKMPPRVALEMAENLACYRDNPRLWKDGTDYDSTDILDGLKSWQNFLDEQDWEKYLASK